MLTKLLNKLKQNKKSQKEINQKLEDLADPFLIERILKHENNGHQATS